MIFAKHIVLSTMALLVVATQAFTADGATSGDSPNEAFRNISELHSALMTTFGIGPTARTDGFNASEGKQLVDKIVATGNQVLQAGGRYQQFVNVSTFNASATENVVQRSNSSSPRIVMRDFGNRTQVAVVVAVNASDAMNELNLTIPTNIPNFNGSPKWISDVLTISRFDENGILVKNTTIRFDLECASPDRLGICRFSSSANESNVSCTVLNVTNGGIVASNESGFCTIISNSTSSFIAFEANSVATVSATQTVTPSLTPSMTPTHSLTAPFDAMTVSSTHTTSVTFVPAALTTSTATPSETPSGSAPEVLPLKSSTITSTSTPTGKLPVGSQNQPIYFAVGKTVSSSLTPTRTASLRIVKTVTVVVAPLATATPSPIPAAAAAVVTNATCVNYTATCPTGFHVVYNPQSVKCASSSCVAIECCILNNAAASLLCSTSVFVSFMLTLLTIMVMV